MTGSNEVEPGTPYEYSVVALNALSQAIEDLRLSVEYAVRNPDFSTGFIIQELGMILGHAFELESEWEALVVGTDD